MGLAAANRLVVAFVLFWSCCIDQNLAAAQQRPVQGRRAASVDAIEIARTDYRRALATHGAAHADTASRGFALATLLAQRGRHDEAKPIYLDLEKSFPILFSPDGEEAARLSNDMAIVWERSGDVAGAEARATQALALLRRQANLSDDILVDALLRVARIATQVGQVGQARLANDEALERLGRSSAVAPALVLTARQQQFDIALAQGRTAEAEALLTPLEEAARAAGRDRAVDEMVISRVRVRLREGRWQAARDELETLIPKLRQNDIVLAKALYYQAFIHLVRSQYVQADGLLRRSLVLYETMLGGHHPVVGRAVHNLALVYQELGNYAQAELFYNRSMAISERAYGRRSFEYANTLLESVRLHNSRRDYQKAESVAREGLGILDVVALHDRRPLAIGQTALGFALQKQEKYIEAEAALLTGLGHARSARGEQATELAVPLVNLAEIYLSTRRMDAALAAVDQAIAIMRRDGMSAPTTEARAITLRARVKARQGAGGEALSLARASSALLQRRGQLTGADAQLGEAEQRIARPLYGEHVALAYRAMLGDPDDKAALTNEAFAAAQAAALSSAARAVGQMSARFSADKDDLGQFIRRRQDLVRDLHGLDRLSLDLAATHPDQRPVGRERKIADERESRTRQIEVLDAAIGARFPRYRELVRPEPVSVAAVQTVLKEGEALIFQITLEERSYVWFMDKHTSRMVESDVSLLQLTDLVRRIRDSVRIPRNGVLNQFDTDASSEIFRRTIGPLAIELARYRHVIFVLDGPLQSISPGLLLPTSSEKPGFDYARLPWLGRTHAISVVPTVNSIVLMRTLIGPSRAREPFAGFGNPLFGGAAGPTRSAAVFDLLRTGGDVDRGVFKRVPLLPDTADELESMRRVLGGRQQHLYLSERATVSRVKAAPLSDFRIIAFATHALVTGEFPGLAEPAILLAPGPAANPSDDGLLRASDISRLNLDAEWVLLSACNTAAPDGSPTADGLSGLAQAFIYAGARALLVSHWAVSSVATVPLTTGTIERYSGGGIAKSEALRLSIESMISGRLDPRYSHPAYWAPFVIVGDGWAN